jgi:tRNA(His) 5'-end guanylyltransferase
MKRYETVPRTSLTPRMPMIVRVDGRAFHTWVKQLGEHGEGLPWSTLMRDAMTEVVRALMREITGAKLAYLQSDEVSVLVTDYDKPGSQAWFAKIAQKVCSVSAAVATAAFNRAVLEAVLLRYDVREMEGTTGSLDMRRLPTPAHFDARTFVVPQDDVCNYFVWRQQDATRNSVSMLAQHHFNHDELQGKSWGVMQEMLFSEKDINWNDCPTWQKRGWCVLRQEVRSTVGELREAGQIDLDVPEGVVVPDDTEVVRRPIDPDWETPIFTKDNWYIDQHVFLEEAEHGRRTQEIMDRICGPDDLDAKAPESLDPEILAAASDAVREEFD